jgi:hypothetical protein
MTSSVHFALLLAGGLFIGVGNAAAEALDCRAQLKRQDEQCQALAEKLADACPGGTNIKETPQCREVSSQIANTCTRKPCAPPPRKGKKATSKSKGMGMGSGVGERSKPTKAAPKSK